MLCRSDRKRAKPKPEISVSEEGRSGGQFNTDGAQYTPINLISSEAHPFENTQIQSPLISTLIWLETFPGFQIKKNKKYRWRTQASVQLSKMYNKNRNPLYLLA